MRKEMKVGGSLAEWRPFERVTRWANRPDPDGSLKASRFHPFSVFVFISSLIITIKTQIKKVFDTLNKKPFECALLSVRITGRKMKIFWIICVRIDSSQNLLQLCFFNQVDWTVRSEANSRKTDHALSRYLLLFKNYFRPNCCFDWILPKRL